VRQESRLHEVVLTLAAEMLAVAGLVDSTDDGFQKCLKCSGYDTPVVSDEIACEGGTIPNLITSGNNIQWYNNSNLDTLIFTGDTLITGETAVDTVLRAQNFRTTASFYHASINLPGHLSRPSLSKILQLNQR